jgi:hypothetical protein
VNEPLTTALSGPAARFLRILGDFGHLDGDTAAEVLIAAAEAAVAEGADAIELPLFRRVAARYLFEHHGVDMADHEGILLEDWPLLFS